MSELVTKEEINKVLKVREERGQKGMILTHSKKGKLINWRLRYK